MQPHSDSDDGRRQKSLIATSELRFGDPGTLGGSHATNTSCTVKESELRLAAKGGSEYRLAGHRPRLCPLRCWVPRAAEAAFVGSGRTFTLR
jgi:hypothetical protein